MTAEELVQQYFDLLADEMANARCGDGLTEVRAKFINEGINMVLDSIHAQSQMKMMFGGRE